MTPVVQGLDAPRTPRSGGWTTVAALACAALVAGAAVAQRPKVPIPIDGPSENPLQPPAGATPELWFPVGERLTFELLWGVIPVGTVRLWTEWVDEDGRWLVAIRMRTQSNRVLSSVYPVDDFIESFVDPVTFLPVRFTRKINEGKTRYDETTVFDHANGVAVWRSHLRDRTKEFAIGPDTRDIPSLMWWFRKERLDPGDTREYMVMADEKIYSVRPMPVEQETISTDRWGRVRCIRFEPEAQFDGLFVRKGRVWMWVSADDRRVAVRVAAQVPVARVRANLVEVGGPGEDRWVGHGPARDLSRPVPGR